MSTALDNFALPDVSREGLSNDRKIQMILDAMVQLKKQLKFTLQALDETNMTEEMNRTITDMKAVSKDIKNALSDGDFSSYIEQTAKKIEMRVEKGKVIAAINISPEEITIQAKKISLEGLVTVNGYFKIDEEGRMTATAGKIAGWTIDTGALYSGMNTAEVSPACYLGTADILKATAIVGSAARKDWRVKVGASFGVTADGTLYAQAGEFRGNVSAGMIDHGNYGGRSYGTMPGGAITIHSVTSSEMENEYQELKADVATFKNLFAGVGTIHLLYLDRLIYRGGGGGYNAVNWVQKTVNGTMFSYLGQQ